MTKRPTESDALRAACALMASHLKIEHPNWDLGTLAEMEADLYTCTVATQSDDGYEIGKRLERLAGWPMDAETVAELELFDHLKHKALGAKVAEWVKREQLGCYLAPGRRVKLLTSTGTDPFGPFGPKAELEGEIVEAHQASYTYLVRFDELGHVRKTAENPNPTGCHGRVFNGEDVEGHEL